MNKIKEIKLDNTNWIEVTFVDENNKEIHCESFGDSDEYVSLFKQRCVEFSIELSEDNLSILAEQKSKRKVFTTEEIAEMSRLASISELRNLIAEANMYLDETSWIWEKYSRNVLVLNNMTNKEFNIKYLDIISKQEQYRLDVNMYEKDILNLKGAV